MAHHAYTRMGLAGVGVVFGALFLAVTLGDNDGDDSAAASTPTRTTSVHAPAAQSYVALGDSYTSGPAIPPQTAKPAGCDRSGANYPSLVAKKLDIDASDFRDMSCSGATIADLTGRQSTDDGVNPAQLSALSSTTGLVTIGVGGNDIGFSKLVTECVKAGAIYVATGSGKYTGDDAPCRSQYVSDGTDEIERKINTAGDRLTDTLAEVARRAPQAHVYVVGYPAILPSEGTGCDDDMTLAPDDATYLNYKERQLNSVLRERAEAAGAEYVDTYTPSVGHDACSARETRWVEPLMPSSPAAPMHPNVRGEKGMAEAVVRAVRGS